MNTCMYMYMNHVDVNLQMYEKKKTIVMRKYEVIFYVRTQHVILKKKFINVSENS